MKNYNTCPFFLEEKKELRPEHLSGAKIYEHIRKYAGFQHICIDEKNRISAFKAIWREFMQFTEGCLSEITKDCQECQFQYLSACDMPVALMPDGSQIVCTNMMPQTPTKNNLFFIWVKKEGIRYV